MCAASAAHFFILRGRAMDFLRDCWELELERRCLYDFLTLFQRHPEWLADEKKRAAYESLSEKFLRQTGGQTPDVFKNAELSPAAPSREEELTALMEVVFARQEAEESFRRVIQNPPEFRVPKK